MKTTKTMAIAVAAMLMAGVAGHAQQSQTAPEIIAEIEALLNRLRAILASHQISDPGGRRRPGHHRAAPAGATVRLTSGTRLRRLSTPAL